MMLHTKQPREPVVCTAVQHGVKTPQGPGLGLENTSQGGGYVPS